MKTQKNETAAISLTKLPNQKGLWIPIAKLGSTEVRKHGRGRRGQGCCSSALKTQPQNMHRRATPTKRTNINHRQQKSGWQGRVRPATKNFQYQQCKFSWPEGDVRPAGRGRARMGSMEGPGKWWRNAPQKQTSDHWNLCRRRHRSRQASHQRWVNRVSPAPASHSGQKSQRN